MQSETTKLINNRLSRFLEVIRLGLEPRAHALKGRCSTC